MTGSGMMDIEHWFCPGCGEIDGPRAGMVCHGPRMTGGCASVGNEVVEISHDAAIRLRGAVRALDDAADCLARAASWITDGERHDWLKRAEARARSHSGGQSQ